MIRQCAAGMMVSVVCAAAHGGAIADRYEPVSKRIIGATLSGNDAYKKLEVLCDDIGHRVTGSQGLDRAVRWASQAMRDDGQENVRLDTVMVPHWERGRESAALLAPRVMPLAMLGLGGSVGTPSGGLVGAVEVVRDEAELDALGTRARGRIILFNNPMPAYTPENGTGYGTAVRFRSNGARLAAEKGALACLIRSVTAHSLRSPHTGMMRYGDAAVRIPAAALSVEDADMIARWRARGVPVQVQLQMEARNRGMVPSANVIGELRGTTHPDEIVIISGHLDSWDVGQGAHDDGGGSVMAMEAINVLRKLDLRPRRTIRVVLWTGEECGLWGAKQYVKDHADELSRHVAAIEADSGTFAPTGYGVACESESRRSLAANQMRDLLGLCARLGATTVREGWSGPDISQLKPAGTVLLGQNVDVSHYFDYHHTHADTLDKIDRGDLDRNVAVMAVVAYIVADLPERLGSPQRF